MKMNIEDLKGSKRGIEIIGWVATPQCDTTCMPDIPARASIEERSAILAPYYALRKEAYNRFDKEKTEHLHLHLGHASLIQADEKKSKGGKNKNKNRKGGQITCSCITTFRITTRL